MVGEVIEISGKEAWEFLKPRHYAGRKPSISIAYGWYINQKLVAVITFGKPASPYLCRGLCGEEYASKVYELNRLCRVEELSEPLSEFIAEALRRLKTKHWIIVSFSDCGMNHNGYIYQACNFLYTGKTKERTDIWGGHHARHYTEADKTSGVRVLRTAKHRYVYFCLPKRERKKAIEHLNYPVMPYPKEQNKNYTLGEYQKPILVDTATGERLAY